MAIIIICIALGIVGGLIAPTYIPSTYTTYVAIAILAGIDSVFGGIAANVNNNFRLSIFVSGLLGNAVLAAALAFFGNLLNLDIYLAAVVVFGTRLFQNFAIIRRYFMSDSFRNKLKYRPGEQ